MRIFSFLKNGKQVQNQEQGNKEVVLNKEPSESKKGLTKKNSVMQLFVLALLAPNLAFAQIGADFIDEMVEWTTNDWAVGIATIAVAVVGYIWLFSKQIEKSLAIRLILGIFFIFGAPTIVDEIRDLVD